MVGKPKGDWLERKKILVLLTLEISRESYLSQLSCSHMELYKLGTSAKERQRVANSGGRKSYKYRGRTSATSKSKSSGVACKMGPYYCIIINGLLWGPYKWSTMNGQLGVITMITPIKWSYINWCLGPLWYHFKIFRTSKLRTCCNPRGPLW